MVELKRHYVVPTVIRSALDQRSCVTFARAASPIVRRRRPKPHRWSVRERPVGESSCLDTVFTGGKKNDNERTNKQTKNE